MALLRRERIITEEQFNRFMADGINYPEVFSEAEICGYGIYGVALVKDGDTYKVTYERGSSCD